MDYSKVNTSSLIDSFQKLGDSHRALKTFAKENRNQVSKQTLKDLNAMVEELEKQQQRLIDFAFDSFFVAKGTKRR